LLFYRKIGGIYLIKNILLFQNADNLFFLQQLIHCLTNDVSYYEPLDIVWHNYSFLYKKNPMKYVVVISC